MENEYHWSLHRHGINLALVHYKQYKQAGLTKTKTEASKFAAYFPIS